jgi:hypothetical protein
VRLATIFAMLMFPAFALGQSQREPLTAYWLSDLSPMTATMYDPLLVITCVPLEQFEATANMQDLRRLVGESPTEFSYILDQPAIFLETNVRDSIWNQDRRPVKPFTGKLVKDKNSLTMNAYGRQYRITSAATADVIRLLRKPEGTKPLHRLHSPISGAERTVHAIALILEDQVEHSLEEGRTKP